MARFTAAVDVAAPPDRVWARLVDWPSHARWAPMTTVRVLTERPDGVGARFVARTGVGPLGFDDPMEVVAWQPPTAGSPGRCEIRKYGRVVLGSAHFDVSPSPSASQGSSVRWSEDVEVAPVRLTRPLSPVLALAGRVLFTRVLRQMAAEVERGA
jgi:hypothetical protein